MSKKNDFKKEKVGELLENYKEFKTFEKKINELKKEVQSLFGMGELVETETGSVFLTES